MGHRQDLWLPGLARCPVRPVLPRLGRADQQPGGEQLLEPVGRQLFELLRTGDPRWAWDFALPQAWLQSFSAHLDTGEQFHGNRNGLSVSGTGTGEGHWHRAGDLSSDDYNYNYGLQLAYALRPSPALLDRIGQAGRTVPSATTFPRPTRTIATSLSTACSSVATRSSTSSTWPTAPSSSPELGGPTAGLVYSRSSPSWRRTPRLGCVLCRRHSFGHRLQHAPAVHDQLPFLPFFHRVWADHFAEGTMTEDRPTPPAVCAAP